MTGPLVLVGASGLAREAIEAVRAQGRYDLVGVLDDDPARRGGSLLGVPVLGRPDELRQLGRPQFLVCTGKGGTRRLLVERLAVPAERYATVVHPSAEVPASCTVEPGSIVLAGCVLTADVTVGRHCVLMPRVTCCHDDRLDDFATLGAGVSLAGDVHIGTGAFLGLNVAVRQHVRIGADAVIGMAAAVLDDVPGGQTWIGVPARAIDRRPALQVTAGRAGR